MRPYNPRFVLKSNGVVRGFGNMDSAIGWASTHGYGEPLKGQDLEGRRVALTSHAYIIDRHGVSK